MKISAVCLAAVAQAIPDTYWPGQNATAGLMCGFVQTLPMSSNQTCTIEILKGGAALVNAGGVFISRPSESNNVFHVHSYDGHGEANSGEVRFQVFSKMSPEWYRPVSSFFISKSKAVVIVEQHSTVYSAESPNGTRFTLHKFNLLNYIPFGKICSKIFIQGSKME